MSDTLTTGIPCVGCGQPLGNYFIIGRDGHGYHSGCTPFSTHTDDCPECAVFRARAKAAEAEVVRLQDALDEGTRLLLEALAEVERLRDFARDVIQEDASASTDAGLAERALSRLVYQARDLLGVQT